ncbi:MAG TPA: type II toxin-antitoxin system RelE/ParE family toxin [Candidatus Rifleibacterium sp.]|nr:type II toxin-antitoxin system RelE/ParE family toxin [Candidatus Rifleibacterium sp.]HPT47508.1 type II toxin-antitoxin system RelE/ParE family toxin [Candidatus Rifleibacterium sp.]
MIFRETTIFTQKLLEILSDDQYADFQQALAKNPALGEIIPGGGGIRKVRWFLPGKGKRGGIRVIYYWAVQKDLIMLLFVYPKNTQTNLSPAEIAILKRLVKEEFK